MTHLDGESHYRNRDSGSEATPPEVEVTFYFPDKSSEWFWIRWEFPDTTVYAYLTQKELIPWLDTYVAPLLSRSDYHIHLVEREE